MSLLLLVTICGGFLIIELFYTFESLKASSDQVLEFILYNSYLIICISKLASRLCA